MKTTFKDVKLGGLFRSKDPDGAPQAFIRTRNGTLNCVCLTGGFAGERLSCQDDEVVYIKPECTCSPPAAEPGCPWHDEHSRLELELARANALLKETFACAGIMSSALGSDECTVPFDDDVAPRVKLHLGL